MNPPCLGIVTVKLQIDKRLNKGKIKSLKLPNFKTYSTFFNNKDIII